MSPALSRALDRLRGELARLRGTVFFEATARALCEEAGADAACIARRLPGSTTLETVALVIDGVLSDPTEIETAGTSCESLASMEPLVTRGPAPFGGLPGETHHVGLAIEDPEGGMMGAIVLFRRSRFDDVDGAVSLLKLFAVRVGAELDRMVADAELATFFELSPDCLLAVDAHGTILRANREASALFGYSHDELVGRPIELLVPAASRERHRAVRESAEGDGRRRMGSRAGREFVGQRKDGSELPVDVALSRVLYRGGVVTLAAVRDVTAEAKARHEREALERELRDSQTVRAIGALAGGIAHDFNNLLAVILGNTEGLLAQRDPSDPAFEALTDVLQAAIRGTEVVRQIVAMSRSQQPRRRSVAVDEIVEEIAKLVRAVAPTTCRISVRVDTPTPRVLADPTQLHRLLMNLATNAWHAVGGRPGSVSIDAALVEGPHERTGPMVRFRISDDGAGMDTATRARVFEPFFTTKAPQRGSGLGMAIVQAIVSSHDGTIDLESEPGRGTRITIHLPAVVEPRTPSVVVPAPPPSTEAVNARVLCLDDDQAVMRATVRMLRSMGCEVEGFTSARAAIAAIETGSAVCDCVLTDYTMPELSGLDVARAVATLRPELPVIIMSGRPPPSGAALDGSIVAWLEKPIGRETLTNALREVIRRRA